MQMFILGNHNNKMKLVNGLLNLFHRKQRFSPEYETLSKLKRVMFLGATGFVVALSVSKFIQASLIYSFEPTEENKLMVKLNPALERVDGIRCRAFTIRIC
jgi:uncharacterized protein YrrD